MLRICLFAGLVAVSGCVRPDAPAPQGGLSVRLVEGYYWPADGPAPGVEVFPLVDALVVGRGDGAAMADDPAAAAEARAAADAWCRARGRAGPGRSQRHHAGTWAFYGCAP